MSNPNNCATCDHSKHPDGGHCYMFRMAPTVACVHHTFSVDQWRAMRAEFIKHFGQPVAAQAKEQP